VAEADVLALLATATRVLDYARCLPGFAAVSMQALAASVSQPAQQCQVRHEDRNRFHSATVLAHDFPTP
jgi:hypothetical protein